MKEMAAAGSFVKRKRYLVLMSKYVLEHVSSRKMRHMQVCLLQPSERAKHCRFNLLPSGYKDARAHILINCIASILSLDSYSEFMLFWLCEPY